MPTNIFNDAFINEPNPDLSGTTPLTPNYTVSAQNSRGNGNGESNPFGNYPYVLERPDIGARGFSWENPTVSEQRRIDNYRLSYSLLSAIFATYTGNTPAELIAYSTARIDAINARAQYIQTRVSVLLTSIQNYVTDTEYKSYLAGFTTVVSLIPGGKLFGVVSSVVAGLVMGKLEAETQQQFTARQTKLINDYKAEYTALSNLYKVANTELITANDSALNQAPKPIPIWYYYVGFALLVALLLWLKKRNQKRRKR